MIDFPNKVVTIVLVFLMLVVAPITWMYVRDDMTSERLVLNEVVQFIDKSTDTALITQQSMDDLYIGLNASGGTYDVEVKLYTPTPIPTGAGESRLLYSNIDYINKDTGEPVMMNKGDLVKVSVQEIGLSPAKKILWTLLRMDSAKTEITLSGSVR